MFSYFARSLSFFAVLAVVLIAGLASVQASPYNHSAAKQAILIDFETGMILFEKNADEKMPTSSMSKVMTMYAVFEALRDGRITLDATLPVSEKAWRKGGSKMFVEVGKRVAVEDLIRGVIIQSGNDATIVLAEGLSGTEDSFADLLNTTAQRLGMDDSHFMNASGWPDPNHYSTARDLAKLAKALIVNFPEYYHYYSEKEFTYNNIKQRNRNPLIYRDMGADGIKTGHTEVGGYGLMASGERDGRRVLLVVNGLEDEKARAQEGARLLEWGLKGFENLTLFQSGETVEVADVAMGKQETVPMVLEDDLLVTLPVTLKNDLDVSVSYKTPLVAPVQAGDEVGTLTVKIPRGETLEIPLVAGDDVPEIGLFKKIFVKLKYLI